MLEVFLTISVAYGLKRINLFTSASASVLVNYVIYFALPAVGFKYARELGFSKEVFSIALGAWLTILGCLLFAFLISGFMKLSSEKRRALALLSAFGNTAFLGYPYTHAYFGSHGLKYAIIYDQLGSFLLVSSVGFLIASGRLNPKEVLLFPPFLSLVLGFASKNIELPQALINFIDFVSLSLLPVVLFALGLQLSFSKAFGELKLLTFVLFLKLLVSPLLAYIVFSFLPVDEVAKKVGILESGMPTMITASLLAIRFGLEPNLAVASAGVGIIVSFITVPLLVRLI